MAGLYNIYVVLGRLLSGDAMREMEQRPSGATNIILLTIGQIDIRPKWPIWPVLQYRVRGGAVFFSHILSGDHLRPPTTAGDGLVPLIPPFIAASRTRSPWQINVAFQNSVD